MGIVRWGPPEDLIILLRDRYRIKTFVETGTFKGRTSLWASSKFKQVETIEFSEKIYKETYSKYKDTSNVNFRYGDSSIELAKIVQGLNQQAIFWLDAHFCFGDSYGQEEAECPLLKELEVINNSEYNHIILIDDARGFLVPPARPTSIKYYPNFKEIVITMEAKYNRSIFIFEDVIIAVPEKDAQVIALFLQDKITIQATLIQQLKGAFTQLGKVLYRLVNRISLR